MATDLGAVAIAATAQPDLGAHGREQAALGFDIADLGDVLEGDFILGEDGRGHASQGRVFGA